MSYPQSWHSPTACMKLCFAGLTKSERKIAAGQLQEVSDLLQRVLLDGTATYDALECKQGHIILCHFIYSVFFTFFQFILMLLRKALLCRYRSVEINNFKSRKNKKKLKNN